MARLTFIFGILLIALGVSAFLLSGAKAVTALIPAFFGIVMLLLAAVASKGQAANKHAMHVAAMLTLVGTLGGLKMGVPNVIKYFQGDDTVWLKALTQGGMGILCIIFLVFCIRSFIQARKSRLQG
jgi:steroid 5-alpha reductase family enzyme